ncbi:MAG: hypothetical protein M0Q54_12730 [Pigmentiphaga sp.]|nr:hypothetical protein [Pigmentiphaga sp.]
MHTSPYLEPRQTLHREPTAYEDLLATGLQSAFSKGATTLEALAESLNRGGPRPQHEMEWTASLLETELARLAAI